MTLSRMFIMVALIPAAGALADVTQREQMTLNVAIVKAHATSVVKVAGDKKRSETDFRCDGLMSLLCGKNQSLEIVRLDRDLIWTAEPKKKQYVESAFPTPEQRRAMEERMRAAIEKMKSCPAPAPTPSTPASVDTSKCEMSAPKFSVNKTDETATFIGHSAHRAIMNMTQSCTDKQTGSVCDMSYTFDVWLTPEEIPELADRRSFDRSYIHKMGLDETQAPEDFKKFLAPYADAMKQLGKKGEGLKGYPLKTSFRVALGGPRCATSGTQPNAGATEGSENGEPSRSAGNSITDARSAAGALTSKLVGGLFAKKKKPADEPANPGATPAPDAGLTQIAEFTIETTALSAESIPASQFEMPPDWKKTLPRQDGEIKEFTCPATSAK